MNTVGHGCPPSAGCCTGVARALRRSQLHIAALANAVWNVAALTVVCLLAACVLPVFIAAAENGQPGRGLSFEVRAVWGGGPVRPFAGTITVSDGSIEVVRNLSVQDDSVGSLRRQGNSEVTIQPHSPSSFGGADLLLKGHADSELRFQWQEPNGASQPEPIRMKLSELLDQRVLKQLDAHGTRLAIERQVHDRIRASVNHGRAILSPGERCSLTVEGYRNDIAAGEYRINVRLIDGTTNRAVAHYQRDVDVNEEGSFAPQTFNEIELPARPGVYCFDIGVQRRRLINSFINAIATADRKVEIVVVDNKPPVSAACAWVALDSIYPAGESWWDSVGKFRVPSVKTLTPLVSYTAKAIGSAEHKRRLVGGAEWFVLETGAWQAFPLPIKEAGLPHRVTIKVPGDRAQKLAFSIQENGSPGDASSLRLDSGLVIQADAVGRTQDAEHELIFWPKTALPYLLVLNTDPIKEAAIAEVSLEVAPAGLTSQAAAPTSPGPSRLAAIYFDKPLLAENFGARRRTDNKGQRELDTWRTAFEASTRLAEYTQWSGHNAAVLTVATQGGACYPSQVLNPSSKFDSGTFLSDGSSDGIKDLAELVCREFDRRGLKLILAVELDGPLAELMRFNESDPAQGSLFQVDREGNIHASQDKPDARRVTRYNPLDPRVQTVLARVNQELLERYGEHPSFAGIQINLSDRCHFSFAGDCWGYDAPSLARFQRSIGAPLPTDMRQRDQLLSGALRLNFLTERSHELAKFYSRLADDVVKKRSDAKLLISPAKLLADAPSSENFAEVESKPLTPSEVLLGCGIDCALIAADKNICLLRPEIDSPMRAPVARAWAYQLAADVQLDAAFSGSTPGAIIQQTPTGFRLPDFDKVSPFGSDKSRTWLFPHTNRAGDAARRAIVSRIFHSDAQVLATGGWMALMGQEAATRPALSVLKQLPPVVMDDLTCDKASATVRVRRTEYAGKTYLQLINNASWSEAVVIALQSKSETTLKLLDESIEQQPRAVAAGQPTTLELALPPYSLAGVCIDGDNITIKSLTSKPEEGTGEKLERRLSDLQTSIDRAGELNEQQTLGLRGSDFETWNANGEPLGWTVSTHPTTSVSEERELPRSGAACVRIENKSNGAVTAWIQSDRIAIPSTGRLALEVWVRSAPGLAQPNVRLSLVGRERDGKRFQRWHDFVPASAGGSQIPIDWGRRPLVLLVPDVPNEELSELHVAIDLVGPGRLWVDDVRVYGMYLHPDEQVHLLGQMYLAKEQLRKGDFTLADQLLESFWACFLSSCLTTAPPSPAPIEKAVTKEAKLPATAAGSQPAWRAPSQPRRNQWQESLRQRWQR